ncbi:ribosome biogenesis protein WDR12 homolog [Cylas formicarius]|uniref:ribosome biogenesis protein WDR12 homolog n=1 Tax=Cylas formicarius TaxID=197179 RepID=UPI002958A8EC|nr:ribosome biogenesis protein WDR12 homolog [Cylas formicarius]
MQESHSNESQIQIRLVTKQSEYAVPDIPLSVPANIETAGLNELLNHLLKENKPDFLKQKQFDFLASGELVRVSLIEHLQERSVSVETTVEVEYIQVTPAPQPEDSILHEDWVAAIETANRWMLIGCYDHSVSIRTPHGKPVTSSKEHKNIVKDVAWVDQQQPSKGLVSVSHDLTGILWAWEEGTDKIEPRVKLRGHERGIDTVAVSPNSNRLATGGWDTNLKIWSASLDGDDNGEPASKKKKGPSDISTRTPIHTLNGHKECISSINWTNNHVLYSASMDHTIKFWDAELCGIKNEIVDQKAFLSSSWSALSNTLLASSADRHIRLYDPRSTEGSVCKVMFTSHTLWVSSVAWSKYSEHLFLSGSYDSTVKMWDTRSPKAPLYNLQGHEGQVLVVDWSNSKYLVSGGTDNYIHIFKNKQIFK